MKQTLALALLVAGVALSVPALAQTTTDQYGTTAGTGTGTTTDQYGTTAGTGTYGTTGWDPGMLLAASGSLAAGSVALKGFLRKRAR